MEKNTYQEKFISDRAREGGDRPGKDEATNGSQLYQARGVRQGRERESKERM